MTYTESVGYCLAPRAAHRVRNCRQKACQTMGCCMLASQVEGGSLAAKPLLTMKHGPAPGHTDLMISPEAINEALARPVQMMPATSQERKDAPICTGVLDYFPLALAAVARLSKLGNDKHNPGQPLHWSRGKSADHSDCIARHLIDRGVIDPDTGRSHTVEIAWRALALLQIEEEERLGLPPSRGSR